MKNIDPPTWIKHKKVTINTKNTKDNNCFQYATTAALNYQNIIYHPERISKLFDFLQQDIKTILRWRKIIAILQ